MGEGTRFVFGYAVTVNTVMMLNKENKVPLSYI